MNMTNRRSFSPFSGNSRTRTSWFPQLSDMLRPFFEKLSKELNWSAPCNDTSP